jgi:hypothetical protein
MSFGLSLPSSPKAGPPPSAPELVRGSFSGHLGQRTVSSECARLFRLRRFAMCDYPRLSNTSVAGAVTAARPEAAGLFELLDSVHHCNSQGNRDHRSNGSCSKWRLTERLAD